MRSSEENDSYEEKVEISTVNQATKLISFPPQHNGYVA